MERLTRATGTEADAMLALLGGCNSETDGVELAYQALDLVVARYDLSEANLVLRPGSMAPQIFVHERGFVTPDLADSLARRPSGLYAVPDDVPLTVQDALTGCCEMALAAHVARRQAGQVVSGLSARPVMEDAVRRSASRSARFRWRFTLVLLGTVGIGPPGSRWQALAEAVRSTRRVCDEAGAAGPGHAAAILADAGAEDVDTYLARLREALARGTAGDVQLVAGSATAPADSVDPDQLWRLCEQRLADATPPGSSAGAGRAQRQPAASELELELRCLPDVVSVGTTGLTGPEARLRSVTVVTRRRNDAIRREAADLAAEQLGDVPLVVLDGGTRSVAPAPGPSTAPANGSPTTSNGSWQPPPEANGAARAPAALGGTNGRPAALGAAARRPGGTLGAGGASGAGGGPDDTAHRVVLLRCELDRATATSEVSVAWRGATAVGRATGSPLAGAAQATLTAVEALGAAVPYVLTSVERATTEPGAPVVVSLAARQGAGNGTGRRRFGVAEGGNEVEAASRATLSALNRLLALMPGALPSGAPSPGTR